MICSRCMIEDNSRKIDWLRDAEEEVYVVYCNNCHRMLGVDGTA